jgi:hypothetical protein
MAFAPSKICPLMAAGRRRRRGEGGDLARYADQDRRFTLGDAMGHTWMGRGRGIGPSVGQGSEGAGIDCHDAIGDVVSLVVKLRASPEKKC